MFIDYTATRETVGSGDDEIETSGTATRVPLEETSESVSMSGVGREYQLDRLEHKWSIQTIPVPLADLPRWREFAASVVAGELFTIDIWGTKASPDDPISVSYIKGTFRETRLFHTHMQFSFEVLER